MDKRIVYRLQDQPVSILIPCKCGLTVQQIGEKDVPSGVSFWIVEASSIPIDRAFRDAWELEVSSMGEPDGYGGTYQEEVV